MLADPLSSACSRSPPMTAPTARRQPAPSPTPGAQHAQAQAHRQAYQRRKTRAKAKGEALRQKEAAQMEALPVQRPHAAGIDIDSRSHWGHLGLPSDHDFGSDAQ